MIKISNSKDIEDYSTSMVYIPNDFVRSNYRYYFNNDYVDIVTDNNCYTQYNSTYCDCYKFNLDNNVVSESYSCNNSPNLPRISNELVSSDINYSTSIKESYLANTGVYLLMFVVAILFATLLLKERKHL